MLQSKNLRIRGKYNCYTDIEETIKELETQFKIDFKSLPKWKEVIEKMNAIQFECKNKLLNAKNRKFQIVEKLYIQKYRASPFELTEKLTRTANLWDNIKYNIKVHKTSSKTQRSSIASHTVSVDNVIANEESVIGSNGHPNSEVIQSKEQISKLYVELDSKLNSPHYLPPIICTNQHKMLSSIGSNDFVLDYKESKHFEKDFKAVAIEDFLPNQTKMVKCYPDTLIINSSKVEQFLKFSLLNCSTECVHIRFNHLSDSSYFKTLRIFPLVSLKLNPGFTKKYKLNFTLREDIEVNDISLILYFRIGSKTTEENLCIPIKGKFEIRDCVIVTETVNIPKVYQWQVNAKCGYPKGIVKIQIYGNRAYNLHIRKKDFDLISDDTNSTESLKVNTPDTESLMRKVNDDEIETQDRTLLSPRQIEINAFDKINIENDILNSLDIVTLVLNDILNIVYEPFIFKNTYLRLTPKSKRIVLVYFTRAEHVGYHQRYYELMFCDSNDVIFTKTIKVFAEVLPHPILIYPNILDITKSPVVFGHCEDHFTIINTHKVCPVTITIKSTHKMNKIFQITPRATSIPANSKVNFNIRFCRKLINASENLDIMIYFTVKIIVNGHKSVYLNVPPFYYEIIAPCTKDKEFIGSQKEYLNALIESSPVEMVLND